MLFLEHLQGVGLVLFLVGSDNLEVFDLAILFHFGAGAIPVSFRSALRWRYRCEILADDMLAVLLEHSDVVDVV